VQYFQIAISEQIVWNELFIWLLFKNSSLQLH